MVDALRTPDDRFAGLPDFPYGPHYLDDLNGFEGLRLHYLDRGTETPGTLFYACTVNRPGAICTAI
jgi:hypothetical protein